ncbi:MAG: metallophosphoesterase [Methylobacter sp.]
MKRQQNLDKLTAFTSHEEYKLYASEKPKNASLHRSLITTLVNSENMVRQMIAQMQGKPVPDLPTEGGHLEYGLMLYWLDNPPTLPPEFNDVVRAWKIIALIAAVYGANTKISTADYNELLAKATSTGVAGADGTLYAPPPYAAFDPYWIMAPIYYYFNIEFPESIHTFGTNPANINISSSKPNISVAIIGDWGTGTYGTDFGGHGPAVAVINAVKQLAPDYLVHLGDVYYVGSDDRLPLHEEQRNLLNLWPSTLPAGCGFTLNSNHEMYGGAQGLFSVALADSRFSQQQKTSYFALNYGNWVILGLDSAYYDDSSLYMDGALGNAENTQQADFIKTLGDLSQKKVLTMAHHNGLTFDGKTRMSIWDDMANTLGAYAGKPRTPDVWYWGHLHQGTVYNTNSAAGNECLCRCVGHSAFPFGDTFGVVQNNVEYNAQTPIASGNAKMQNGFAMLTLKPDGTMTETFYEVKNDGSYTQVWQSHS